MSPADRAQLVDFRRRYPGLTWDRLGRLFGFDRDRVVREWVDVMGKPTWWATAIVMLEDGRLPRQVAHAVGRSRRQVLALEHELDALLGRRSFAPTAARGA